jgi:hypothetical protein
MSTLFLVFFSSLRSSFRSRAALQAEILALRHQLLVLQRSTQRRRLQFRAVDRIFWAWLSRLWQGWRSPVWIMKAETVVAWNRKGFRLYWTWKSRTRKGRPCKPRDGPALAVGVAGAGAPYAFALGRGFFQPRPTGAET